MRMFSIAICLLASVSAAAGVPLSDQSSGGRFWKDRITAAVSVRNAAFREVAPRSADITITSWPQQERVLALQRIDAGSTAASGPWHIFIKSIILGAADTNGAGDRFDAVLDLAQHDPGVVWLFFVEFDRYGRYHHAQKALALLEKQMFIAGGSAAGIISRQLLHYGRLRKISGDDDAVMQYFQWAHRFDPGEITSIIIRARLASIRHPILMSRALAELPPVLAASWRAQLEVVSAGYRFLRHAAMFSVLFILVIIAVRRLPEALHPFTHRYPDRMPPAVRMVLTTAVFLSLSAFGALPFAWLLTAFLWRFLSKPERWLLGIVAVTITLSPLDASVRERLDRLSNPDGDMMLLAGALTEGSGPVSGTEQFPATPENGKTARSARDLAAAASLVKQGDSRGALRLIERQPSDDPVAANIKAVALMLDGNFDSAANSLSALLLSHPDDAAATFNLSRCRMALNDASTGMELLKKAAMLNPSSVNAFITGNDRYFSADWPLMRKMMFPDYSPVEFWKRFFLRTPSPENWNDRWGMAFLGVPPQISFVLFFCIFLVMVIAPRLRNSTVKMRRIFECKYCGRTACRQCSSGVLCNSCSDSTIHFKGSHSFGEVIERIARSASHKAGLRSALFSIFIPGSGTLLRGKGMPLQAVAGILGSAIIYTWWTMILRGESFAWMTPGETLTIVSIPVLFHLSCIIFYLPAVLRHLPPLVHSASSGERTTDGSQRHTA